jgi:hypothetical protein
MKTLRAIRDFDWRAMWAATKTLLAIYGAIALISFFAAPLQPLEVAGAILFVVATWYVMFRFVQAMNARKSAPVLAGAREKVFTQVPKPRRTLRKESIPCRVPSVAVSSAEPGISDSSLDTHHSSLPKMRRRFVYFDAEKGEEVYKLEPAA